MFEVYCVFAEDSFNYMHISEAVTNDKIINVERTLHARGKISNNRVNLKYKESNWDDAALWNTHLLIKQIGFVVAKSYAELSILQETLNEESWLIEQFLNGTSAHNKLFSAMKIL